ncbi:maleylpyruvate isomerase N-terminal domain-containing protein [Nocardioides nanhaiensis]
MTSPRGPLTAADYLHHLRADSARARTVLRDADPSARVPGCPDWSVDDLLWHLGPQVQGFWAYVVRRRPAPPADWEEPTRPADHAGVLAAFDEAHAALVTALEAADPAEEAWSWSPDQTVGFTLRRQAHEALVHRVDAEQAAGVDPAPIDPWLAADGVEETLAVMFRGKPDWGVFAATGQHVRVDLTDAAAPVWVQLGRFTGTDPEGGRHDLDDIAVVPDPHVEPDVVIAGPAAAVDLWLWRRGDDAAVTATGDSEAHARFLGCVAHPIE